MTADLIATLRAENEALRSQLAALQAEATHGPNADYAPTSRIAHTPHVPLDGQPSPAQKDHHRLLTLFDALADAIFIIDETGHCIAANPAACSLFGMSHDAVLASNFFEMLEAHSTSSAAWWREFMHAGPFDGELHSLSPDKAAFIFEGRVHSDFLPGEHLIILRDTTEQSQIIKQLALSENQLRSFIESQNAYLVRVDLAGNYRFANPAFLRHFGFDGDQLIGLPTLDTVMQDDWVVVRATVERCLAFPGAPSKVVIHKPSPDGGIFATLWEFVAVCDLSGAVDAIQCVGFDITDRVAVEQALRESEARFRAVFENAAIGIAILDASGTLLSCNPALATMLGYSEVELRRRSVADITHPDDFKLDAQYFEDLISGRRNSYQLEKRYFRKDGALVWARLSVTTVRGVDGEIQNVITVVEDITERHLAGEMLRRNEGRLRAILENALDLVSFVSADMKTEYVSPAFSRVFGYELDELINQQIGNWIHPEDLPIVYEKMEELLAHPGATQRLEYRSRTRDGEWLWIENRVSNYLDDPAIGAIVSHAHDISERKQADAEIRRLAETLEQRVVERTRELEAEIDERRLAQADLQEQRDFSRQLTEAMGQGLVVYDVTGIVEYANPFMSRFSGYPLDQIIGRPLAQFVAPDQLPVLAENMRRRGAGRAGAYELVVVDRDGGRHHVLVSSSPFFRQGQLTGGIAVITDISERRRAEEALRLSEEKYRLLAENMTDIIMQFDLDGELLYASPSIQTALGIDPENASTAVLLADMHPDDRQAEADARLEFARTGVSTTTTRRLCADDYYVWFETVSRLARHPQTGEPVFIVSSSRDISARKAVEQQLMERTAELQRANLELAQASRLKDEFLANVSHELRTPLTGVLGLTEALQAGVYGPVDDRKLRILQMVEEAGRHLLNLINDILDLSKIEAGQLSLDLQDITISDLCEASIRMVQQIAHQKHQKLHYHIEPPRLVAQGDIKRLKQILVNLLGNAVKFTPDGGELGLNVRLDRERGRIDFTVWDHGIGIAGDQQTTIFQPFVQIDGGLARQYTGTGLGLALARKLTELHNGTITVTSTVGTGSEFCVSIPWVHSTTLP